MTILVLWGASWITALVNHLWQSTAVAGIGWLLVLVLRKNQARVRYGVWFAASIKFLLPFSLLVAAGEWLRSLIPAVAVTRPAVAGMAEEVMQPFEQTQLLDTTKLSGGAHHTHWLSILLVLIWACGALIVAGRIARGWWRVYRAMRSASPLDLEAGVPVLSCRTRIEPGVFGLFRPVLLLPEEVLNRLSEDQLNAILAHEMCHVRRRDNLTFALHMMVETLFWFHPAVWWIGARLIEERELACDEALVRAGGNAHVYAEGILNVCKFYIESPVACVAGVTGADLKKRIVRIVEEYLGQESSLPRQLLLGTVGAAAIAMPLAAGLAYSAAAQVTAHGWEKASGGKQQFDVASVRENKSGGGVYSNFSLDSGNAYFTVTKGDAMAPTGSLFSARNQTLARYIIFAYRLSGTQELALRFDYLPGLALHVPALVRNSHYDIEARAPGTATKDQMRLMMQSLLAERFKLVTHWETRQAPVFALVEDKPGKLGTQIQGHKAGNDCVAAALPDQGRETATSALQLDALPIPCGMIAHLSPSGPNAGRFGGRNVPLALLADSLPTQTGMATLPRPVIDETGLQGGYDFWMEWTPEDTSEVNNQETGGNFRDALKNQLGLKLVPKNGPVEVLVIDHVEQPSAN